MKVILQENVKSLGKRGEIVTVSDGYARNLLFPKNLAVEATKENRNTLKLKQRHEEKEAAEQLAAAKKLAEQIESVSLEAKLKTGEGGKTFGSVSAKEIAEAAKKQKGLELDKKKIQMDGPIRELGVTVVSVKLHPQVTAQLKVHVSGE